MSGGDQIDYASRYASLVALCREHAKALRAIKKIAKFVPDKDNLTPMARRIIDAEEKIDRRLVEWQELEE